MAALAPINTNTLCPLLSLFSSALHGAVDAGASSCFYRADDETFDRTQFIERGYGMRLRGLLPEIHAALGGHLPAELDENVFSLLTAIHALDDFAKMSRDDLCNITERIITLYFDLRMTIASVARQTECRVKFLDAMSSVDEDYYEQILGSLYSRLRQAQLAPAV